MNTDLFGKRTRGNHGPKSGEAGLGPPGRCLMHGERHVVPRVCDLAYLAAGSRGKVELMLAEDERTEDKLIALITGEAVKEVFEKYAKISDFETVVAAFADKGFSLEVGDDLSTADLVANINRVPALKSAATRLCESLATPANVVGHLAAAAEFILEALYVSNRLSKYAYQRKTIFKR